MTAAIDGVYFKIKANVESFFLVVAWAVKIDKMYEELDRWTVRQCFYETDEPRRLFEESSLQWNREHIVNYNASLDDREFHYSIPAQCIEKFQDQERLNRPREVYQLVIVAYRDPTELALIQPTDIVRNLSSHFIWELLMIVGVVVTGRERSGLSGIA